VRVEWSQIINWPGGWTAGLHRATCGWLCKIVLRVASRVSRVELLGPYGLYYLCSPDRSLWQILVWRLGLCSSGVNLGRWRVV